MNKRMTAAGGAQLADAIRARYIAWPMGEVRPTFSIAAKPRYLRAGLPETGGTRRSAAVRGSLDGRRTQAHEVSTALDRENGVVR